MTLFWVIAGLLADSPVRAVVVAGSTMAGQPPRRECPECSGQLLSGRRRWRPVLSVTGRCHACQARIGPPLLLAELAAGGALAIVAARASSGWELAAFAWLALIAVPLALTDVAVHRFPDRLTGPAFAGTLALLTVAALTAHQPARLARAAIWAAALACFYLALCLLRPGQMGRGDAKLAASIGLVLAWPADIDTDDLFALVTAAEPEPQTDAGQDHARPAAGRPGQRRQARSGRKGRNAR